MAEPLSTPCDNPSSGSSAEGPGLDLITFLPNSVVLSFFFFLFFFTALVVEEILLVLRPFWARTLYVVEIWMCLLGMLSSGLRVFLFHHLFVLLHLRHAETPGPEIKPVVQQ